jgi:hypothetical protein
MAAKDDASTEIVRLTQSFAEDMTKACAKLRKARMETMAVDEKKGDKKDDKKKTTEPPVVTFVMEKTPITQFRTPADQADLLTKPNKTSVCWSAHMADKARHVLMMANGVPSWAPQKIMGEDFDVFKKKWAEAMKSNGLENAAGKNGWYPKDAFHLEIPDSKVPYTDERAAACMVEYARLTREKGKPQNNEFEKEHGPKLAPYLKMYEKKK